MRRLALAAVALWLASGWAAVARTVGQPTTPSAGADVADLRQAVASYIDEQHGALPALQQQLQAEETAARQFAQYLRRMHTDAALQRTVLALGDLRAPTLAQA